MNHEATGIRRVTASEYRTNYDSPPQDAARGSKLFSPYADSIQFIVDPPVIVRFAGKRTIVHGFEPFEAIARRQADGTDLVLIPVTTRTKIRRSVAASMGQPLRPKLHRAIDEAIDEAAQQCCEDWRL
jgi:hypothetical protein